MKNPKLISKPFAQNGQKNVIPEKYETSMESNQATWDQGFGQITMLPVSAGGLPPKGQDFNGILNQMCETIVHISKGGVFKLSVDYATAINGYPKGAILQSEDEKKYYQSLIDNNKVNFNTASQDQIKASWKLVMTDDLLDQLSKKLESSAVAQSTGSSTTSVMSQKASTDAFQPKGNYADKSSYSVQKFNSWIEVTDEVQVSTLDIRVGIKTSTGKPTIISKHESGVWRSIDIPDKSGTMALTTDISSALINYTPKGDSYTKSESDNRYQPKGSYQPSGNYALAGASYTKSESDAKYQLKGEYQLSGYSYSKQESDSKYQQKGNYLDKNSSSAQEISANFSARRWVIARSDGNSEAFLYASSSDNVGISAKRNGEWMGDIKHPMDGKSGTLARIEDIEALSTFPVGSPIPWSLSTAPSGYLICQGQTFNKTTYPKLAIAYPSGRLPELRSEFIRGADAGRGVDAGRQILSTQAGNSLLSSSIMREYEKKGFELKINNIGTSGTDNQGWHDLYQQIEGQNGNETRPRNIAFLYIVRAA